MVADAGFEAAVPVAPSVGVAQVVGQRVLDGLLPCLGRRGDEPVDVRPYSSHVANLSPHEHSAPDMEGRGAWARRTAFLPTPVPSLPSSSRNFIMDAPPGRGLGLGRGGSGPLLRFGGAFLAALVEDGS